VSAIAPGAPSAPPISPGGRDGQGPDGEERRPRRRARVLVLAGATAVVAAAAVIVAVQPGGGRSNNAPRAVLPPGETTATVTRQTLADQTSVDGTLGYGGSFDLYDRLSGTFTWLPSVGAQIRPGQVLWRLNQQAVVLMDGSVPAYRTLTRGVSDGADVAQLNANLKALGFDPYGEIAAGDGHFSDATAAAVRRLQSAYGLSQTGAVALGRVVFAPGARRVTAVRVQLGATAGSGSSPSSSAAKSPRASDSSAPDALAVSTTSTRPQVQVALGADKQQIARVGARVGVTLPDGRVAHGRIQSVGTVATAAQGGGSSATVPVTITLDHPVVGLDQAPVSVTLTRSRRRNVLTVPTTALVAAAGGGYALVALENGRRVELPVTPGLFAGGSVEVSGPGVYDGLTVIQSQ
jgi:peptidoglycan hydrolase-like protein with peptidoglycan-binding domain